MIKISSLVGLIERQLAWLGRAVSWLSLFMVLLTMAIVVLRYGFSQGSIAMQESVLYAHAALFLLNSAFTLQQDQHVRVDIFYKRLSVSRQGLVNLLGALTLALPTAAYIGWISQDFVLAAWRIKESSNEAGGLPLLYILKALLPLFALTMVLQSLVSAWRAAEQWLAVEAK